MYDIDLFGSTVGLTEKKLPLQFKFNFSGIAPFTLSIGRLNEAGTSSETFSTGHSFHTTRARGYAWVAPSKVAALESAVGLDTTLEIGSM